jgi:uncharacterized protein
MNSKIPFGRREFLISAAALGSGALIWNQWGAILPSNITSRMGLILGGGQGLHQGKKIYFLSAVNLNLSKPTISHMPMSFLPHGIVFNPQSHGVISVFEKKGPGACQVNLKTGEIKKIVTDKSRFFYGHGVYVSDSNSTAPSLKLLSTETILSTGEGLIVIRDANTLKVEGQFPSYGSNPHDCQLIENGRVLAITNGGAPIGQTPLPSVTYVDVFSQKLLEKFEIENPKYNAGHLAISKNMDLAVVSAPRLGLPEDDLGSISILSKSNVMSDKGQEPSTFDKKLILLKEPKEIVDRLKSETLSLFIDDQRGILAATSPAGNLVTFWKIQTGEFLSSLEMSSPRGIIESKDQKHYLISYDQSANLAFVNADTLKIESNLEIPRAGFSGSHLYLMG